MQPIEKVLKRPIVDCVRNRDYQARTDRNTADRLEVFDIDQGLIIPEGEPATWDPAESAAWDEDRRRQLSRRPEWQWFYDQGRSSASFIGRVAFCYRHALSRYHRDPAALEVVRSGLRAFRERQVGSGSFEFCPVGYSTIYGSHEMAWKLEPLIYAYVWAGDDLPADEREAAWDMLVRAAAFLRSRCNTDPNNRGAVWCAITALAGLLLEDQSYLEAARANWDRIAPRIFQAGQIMEDTGPDSNYSYACVAYVYLYRLYADDASLDAPLSLVQHWFARMRTLGGVPFEGMSSRMTNLVFNKLYDVIPMLERYAREEPFYTELVNRYLRYMDNVGRGSHVNHGCDMRIWAMMEHDPSIEAGAPEPDWYRAYAGEYKTDATLYAVVKREYQTAITLRAPLPMKGLQTWAFGDEPPLIHPAAEFSSGTKGWGIDTAALYVGKAAGSGVWADREAHWGSPDGVSTYSMRQEELWTHYVFTPVATLVVISGDIGRRVTQWVINTAVSPHPTVGDAAVSFEGLRGRLFFVGGGPEVHLPPTHGAFILRFEREADITPFAFSNETFRFRSLEDEGERIEFDDSSGRYVARVTSGSRQRVEVETM